MAATPPDRALRGRFQGSTHWITWSLGLAGASFGAPSATSTRSSRGHPGAWRTMTAYLFLPFPEVDGGRINTVLAIPSSMVRKYARCRVSAGRESSNTALSANP